MPYENTLTGEFGFSFETAITESNVSAARGASEIGVFKIYDLTPLPDFDRATHYSVEVRPQNGKQAWDIVSFSPEQVDANRKANREHMIDDTVSRTQQRLDDFAKTRNYDGILSACTYATSPTPEFQTEGQYCVEARDNTWATLYQIMREVEVGTRPMPSSYADIENELPSLTWPI